MSCVNGCIVMPGCLFMYREYDVDTLECIGCMWQCPTGLVMTGCC